MATFILVHGGGHGDMHIGDVVTGVADRATEPDAADARLEVVDR